MIALMVVLALGLGWHLSLELWMRRRRNLSSKPQLHKLLAAAELEVLQTLKKSLSKSRDSRSRERLKKIEEKVGELEREL
jgi:hypothetical protein